MSETRKIAAINPSLPSRLPESLELLGKREDLLVIEVEKVTNHDFDGDIWKLKGMTEQAGNYAYTVGLHLVVDARAGSAARCDVYVDANPDEKLTEWMRLALGGAA